MSGMGATCAPLTTKHWRTCQSGLRRIAPTPIRVTGFLLLEERAAFLDQDSDKDFTAFMCLGLTQTHSFRIGFDQACPLEEPPPNFQLVLNNLSTTDDYMANEVALRHLAVATHPATRRI